MKRKITFLLSALFALMLITQSFTVMGQAKPDPIYEYVLVEDYSSLSTTETYVIAGNIKGGSTWYSLKNNQVTSVTNLPHGSTLSISNKKITSTVTDNETWVLEAVTNYADRFYIKSTKGNYYLQNDGSGTGSKITSKSSTDGQNIWKIHYYDENGSNKGATALYNVGVSRLLAAYNNSNWRCYTSSNYGNIDGAEVVLYKRQEVSSDPTVTASPTSLSGFSYVYGEGPSSQDKHITVSGTNLAANLVVTASSNYEVCKTIDGTYTTSVEYEPSTGTVSDQTVYVHLKSGLSAGNYNSASDKLTVSSGAATPVDVALSGTVIPKYTLTISATNGHIEDGDGNTLTTGSVAQGTEIEITAVPNTGYNFTSWTVSGTGSSVVDDDEITTTFTMGSEAATLTANFEARTPITVTWHDGNNGASTRTTNTYTDATFGEANAGALLTPASVNGWTAIGWATSYSSGYPVLVTASTIVGSTTDLYAVYRHGNDVIYQLTTSTSDLSAGTRYMMGYYNSGYLLMTTNFAGTSAISLNASNQYTYTAGTQWTLGGSNNAWTFTDSNGKLLSSQSTSSASASLKLETTATDYSYWSISYDDASPKHSKIQNNGNVSNNSKYLKISYYSSIFNCYDNAVVYLFKEITEYTTTPTAEKCYVTYDGNDATSGDVPEDDNAYDPNVNVTVFGNSGTLAKTGNTWSGWCLNEAGTGTVYGPTYTTTYTIQANTTFYAKWTVNSYSYTLTDDSHSLAELYVGGSTYSEETIPYGTEVEVVVDTDDGYGCTISVKDAGNNDVTLSADHKFTMPASTVTITVTSRLLNKYTIVTTSNPIVTGKHYIIVGKDGDDYYAMGKDRGSNRLGISVEIDGSGKVTENEGLYELVISGSSSDYWTIYDDNTLGLNEGTYTEGYLYASGGTSSNQIKTQASNDNKGQWTITVASGTNLVTIMANISTSGAKKYLKYNHNSGNPDLFSCYDNSTANVYLYVRDGDDDCEINSSTTISSGTTTVSGDMNIASGVVTITNGATLTVTGTLTNTTASNLVIEDGGQLITSNSVAATIVRNITSAESKTVDDHWYTIASSVDAPTFASVTNLTTDGTYDLYRYDEESFTWQNSKKIVAGNPQFSSFQNGRGYLYRKAGSEKIKYVGDVNVDDLTYTLMSYASDNESVIGFNLIGNPFPHNIYKGYGGAIDESKLSDKFYYLDDNSTWQIGTYETPIKPGMGIMVQTNSTGDITIKDDNTAATSEKEPAGKAAVNEMMFTIANSQYKDAVYAVFDDGYGLYKLEHQNTEAPMVYITQNDKRYGSAMMSDDVRSFNLNFKAKTLSQYTLSCKAFGKFDYVHVIDRLTGEDIDMLFEGEYSFVAAPEDMENRFIVKLGNSANNNENDVFVFQNGNDIIVNGEGELQIFDVTGRMVSTMQVNGVETLDVSLHGVYIFKLNEKVQKIVVR